MSNVKQFGLWSWGHVIYDYRGYFNNMKSLGMNSVIIWNDIVPLNVNEIISYAHSLDIRVIWGFAWGWVDNCSQNIKSIDDEAIRRLSDEVIDIFENEYKNISLDGIYFQSFTELGSDNINGVCIAEAVTGFVNKTAARIYKIAPECEILFGLHATSVRNHLDKIKAVDSRIRIIWEDCGAFPYNYDPCKVEDFAQTTSFVENLLCLRGKDEKCGFIIKGMTTLDWSSFKYHTKPYEIGTSGREFIEKRLIEKREKWKTLTDGWNQNRNYFETAIEQLLKSESDIYIHGLVEDGMFEVEIAEPVRILSETVIGAT